MSGVFKFKSADLCPDKANHADQPADYGAASEWAEKMAKTHKQERCPTCGYWALWEPK